MQNRAKWLVAALAMIGVAGAVYAQSPPAQSPPTPSATPNTSAHGGRWQHDADSGWGHHGGGHWRHHHRHGGSPLMHVLHELNLTDAQKQSVHSILDNARTQFQAQREKQGKPNFAALANPGDPNHAAALKDLQSRMAARLQARDQVQQQIYGVLTPDQKTHLASILAAKQAKMAQHGDAG